MLTIILIILTILYDLGTIKVIVSHFHKSKRTILHNIIIFIIKHKRKIIKVTFSKGTTSGRSLIVNLIMNAYGSIKSFFNKSVTSFFIRPNEEKISSPQMNEMVDITLNLKII